jgi:NADPH:quinone reductase-like Zn-dependent oxidoreductase
MRCLDSGQLDIDGHMTVKSILIHSACGGVGLAAVQIALMIGAEVSIQLRSMLDLLLLNGQVLTVPQIYCTVGHETKIQYLVDHFSIDRSRIFNSRDASFESATMRATNGRGVNVVLNSLSGDLLQSSWKCVAEFGTMIEIGKRDFRRRAKLSMENFELNRTFVGLDIWQISQVRPDQAAK